MDPSPYAEQRYKDGLEYARMATQYDQQRHFSGAMAFYSEAVEALSQACAMAHLLPHHGPGHGLREESGGDTAIPRL